MERGKTARCSKEVKNNSRMENAPHIQRGSAWPMETKSMENASYVYTRLGVDRQIADKELSLHMKGLINEWPLLGASFFHLGSTHMENVLH
jgi:hypothetical protein